MNTDEIRAALTAATPGPWYWRNTQGPMLMGDRSKLVMSFEHMGMHGAQPLFRDEHCVMQPGGRANLYSFPDAHLIANAPTYIADLLAEVDRLAARAEAAEQAIQLVRELHTPEVAYDSEHHDCEPSECDRAGEGKPYERCAHCSGFAWEQLWPCSTISALDGGES